MNYAELTDDELRLEVARRCGWTWHDTKGDTQLLWLDGVGYGGVKYKNETEASAEFYDRLPDYPRDVAAAIALLESAIDGINVEYNIGKQFSSYSEQPPLDRLDKPQYTVIIWGTNHVSGPDYEATADTLPRAACLAWLMWMERKTLARA